MNDSHEEYTALALGALEDLEYRDEPIEEDKNDVYSAYVSRWKSSSAKSNGSDLSLDYISDTESIQQDENLESDEELPIFADDLNKNIYRETKSLERKLEEVKLKVKDHTDRYTVMKQHLNDVQQEINHTNSFYYAFKKGIETEDHLLTSISSDNSRYRQDIEKKDHTISNERKRLKKLQSQIFNAHEEINNSKGSLDFNHDELEKWAIMSAKKEDNSNTLQKYMRSDDAKMKELILSTERLAKSVSEKKVDLGNEVTETQAFQTELERMAEEFKTQHDERGQLVGQWQETIMAMQQRDKEINEVGKSFAEDKKTKETLLTQLKKSKEKFHLLKIENDAEQQLIDSMARTTHAKKRENTSTKTTQQALKDDLEALQFESVSLSSSILNKKANYSSIEVELQGKETHLNLLRKICDSIKMRVEEEKKKTYSHTHDAKLAEEYIKDLEKTLKFLDTGFQAVKEKMFHESQCLSQFRREEKNIIAEIKGSQAVSKNLSSKLHDLDSESERQGEHIYNANFQVQQIEQKVARGFGQVSEEEGKKLRSRISDLQDDLSCVKCKQKYLYQQCRKVQNELRRWLRKNEISQSYVDVTEEKKREFELEISSCEKRISQIMYEKEDVIVSHDLLRLEVNRMRDALKSKVDEMHSQEIVFDERNIIMKEQKGESKVLAEVKIAQLRAAEDYRQKNSLELGQRRLFANKLKNKYETLLKANISSQENNGVEEEYSKVYFIIKAAQKKEEFQREGDKLDEAINKKNKEIHGMRKIMTNIKEKNRQFRLSFSKADMSSIEGRDFLKLEKDAKLKQEKLIREKIMLQQMQDDFEKGASQSESVKSQSHELESKNVYLNDAYSQVKSENNDMKFFLLDIETLTKELRNHNIDEEEKSKVHVDILEMYIFSKVIDSTLSNILHTFEGIAMQFPEVDNDLKDDIQNEGLLFY